MGLITLEALDEGRVLAADVHDINGRLLLSQGQVLGANHLRVLKIWGITEVEVSGDAEEALAAETALDPDQLAAAEAAVAAMFDQLDLTHETMAFIYECAINDRCANGRSPASLGLGKSAPTVMPKIGWKDIQAKIDRNGIKLPEAPTIVLKLNHVIADPQASADDVAQIVGTSPSLTALILRIVNSAAFGLPTRVDRISRAVTLLGTREISALAMGVSVMKAFMDISRDLIDMEAFLRHSLACATISRYLAALSNSSQTEQLFIAGLLHDIGKLILLKYFPQEIKALFQITWANNYRGPFYAVEKAAIGRTHAQLAGQLLKKWQFPIPLQHMVRHHHTPSKSQCPAETVLVQMADLIVNAVGLGSSGERVIPGFDTAAWGQVEVTKTNLKMAIRQAEQQLRAMDAILSVEGRA
ncbi:MAG: HDOD domain-containing protein [Desulfosarcinaceae bacterium]